MSKIAVAGATGRVGSQVVDVLEERGHEVVRISRSKGVDVVTGVGLAEALAGVDVIVDAATGPSPDEKEATDFFSAAASNLQKSGQEARVERIVVVSIVGIDGTTFRLLQGEDLVKAWRHPDGGFEKCFCSECGAHLFSRNPDDPRQMSIRLGAFDGDPGVRPSWRTFVAYAAPWEPVPDDGLEHFAEGKPR